MKDNSNVSFRLKKMLEMQDKLNKETIKEDWRKENSRQWNLAIVIEASELIDSLDWKWWKKGEDDLINAQIEIIDIWHFVLSFALNKKAKYSYGELAEDIEFIMSYNTAKIDKIDAALDLINTASKKQHKITISELVIAFKQLMTAFDMTFDKIYGLYIGKNILNKFRQNNGYKNGEYIKTWNIDGKEPIEDNIYMFKIVEDNIGVVYDILFEDYIYKELKKKYMEVKSVL